MQSLIVAAIYRAAHRFRLSLMRALVPIRHPESFHPLAVEHVATTQFARITLALSAVEDAANALAAMAHIACISSDRVASTALHSPEYAPHLGDYSNGAAQFVLAFVQNAGNLSERMRH
jgi:hypothetical protein